MTRILKFTLAAIVCLSVVAGLYLASFFFRPDVSALAKKNPEKTAFMEYRENQWEREGRGLRGKQTWVPLSRISPHLRRAVVISEDGSFWSHEGFDFDAIRNAVETDIRVGGFKYGASTITQQLAKNLYLSPSKNPLRKMAEAILTYRIEKELTKSRILEIYLNVVEWGDGVFGAEEAARRYFGKSASALSPEESARLAVVLPNPLRLNPVRGTGYVPKRAKVIVNAIIERGDMENAQR